MLNVSAFVGKIILTLFLTVTADLSKIHTINILTLSPTEIINCHTNIYLKTGSCSEESMLALC